MVCFCAASVSGVDLAFLKQKGFSSSGKTLSGVFDASGLARFLDGFGLDCPLGIDVWWS